MKKFSTSSNIVNSLDNTEESSFPSKNQHFEKHLEGSILANDSKYNTGRWSQEEHKKFVEAIFKYGNEWKKIKEFIGSRSSTQARSHAQKFFIRLKKTLFHQNFNLKRQSLDQNSIANVITCFQDCLPSNRINVDDSDKLMKMLLALSNQSRKKDDKIEKTQSSFDFNQGEKYNLNSKKLFLIEKVHKDDKNISLRKHETKLNSTSTESEPVFLKENIKAFVYFRKVNIKKRSKIKLKRIKRELSGLNKLKELKNNLDSNFVEKVIFNDDKKRPIFLFEKYSDKSKKNFQNQGVFEEIRSYYQELYNKHNFFSGHDHNYLDQNIKCPIEHINVEKMFNLENPFYTHNKLDTNYEIN